MGVAVHTAPVVGDWLADPAHWTTLRARLAELVAAYLSERPTEDGIPVEAARHRLGLPAVSLVEALVTPPLRMSRGRVTAGSAAQPASVADAVRRLTAELDGRPFAAPARSGSRNSASAAESSPRRCATERYCGSRSTWCCCRTPPTGGRPAERTRATVHRGNGEPRPGHHPTRHRSPAGTLRRSGHHPGAS